jgi:beta-galactosidase
VSNPSAPLDPSVPFDPRESFALGVCYYPEHWPRDRWEGYAARMRELGLAYVRIAEFAWSRMEPRPGEFDWAWLDDAIEVLHRAGLKVVLCTPTATPPAWLIRAHPEVLPVDAEGRVRAFGSRKHYDHASPVYREHSRRITEAIAARYGEYPAVVGWQTDNEFGCHGTTRSYGTASTAAFRTWLERRYGTLAALNEAWGTVFWSQEYGAWDQIDPPHLTVAEPNPSHLLDFYRFASDMVVEFQEEQVAILRRRSPGRWVTHNFMMQFDEFDHFKAARCLDFASWDSYPLGQVDRSDLPDAEKLRWARTGHPDLIGWNHDLYRCLTPRRAFWVMEQGAGQVNWAAYNPLPVAGAVALWSAQAYAHGADVVSYFRWRAATMAQELMHSGLLRHDETLDRGGEEIAALEIAGRPNGRVPTSVALLHDYDSLWVQDAQPHAASATYWAQASLFYGALRSLGVDVDIRHPDDDLTEYKAVVAPALQIVGPERAANLQRAVEAGTRLVVGPRTGYRAPTGQVHPDGQPGPLRALLGCSLLDFDSLRPGLTVRAGGHLVGTWAESYRLTDGTAEATYDDGPLAGLPAVVCHGNARTVGAWSPSLVGEVLARTLTEAGVPITPLPDGVRVSRRGDLLIRMNFNQETARLPDGTELGPVSVDLRPA